MAFNDHYEFFRKDGGFMNEEFNVLPLFGFEHTSESRKSVENIGSKTTATYQGNGKFELSTSAPNLYFKHIGYDVTYERKKQPTGRALELEERFEQLLKNKGQKIDDTKYVSRDLTTFYSRDNVRPTPPFPEPNTKKFILGGIFSLVCMVVAVILIGIVFADKIEAMIPEFMQNMGLYSMQVAYPVFMVLFGIAALCFFIAFKKKKEYKARLEKFNGRSLKELSSSEIEELKQKMISYAKFRGEYDGEMLDIVLEMIEINNKKIGY